MLQLYLARHGETRANQEHRYLGRSDLELTTEGLRQAQALSKLLETEKIDVLIASPLRRTMQTAEVVARRLNINLTSDERWMELDFGAWDKLTFEEVQQRDPICQQRWLQSPEDIAPTGGESVRQLRLRIGEALADIQRLHNNRSVLVVTHGGPIRVALNILTGQSIWDINLPCGSVYQIQQIDIDNIDKVQTKILAR